MAFTSLEITANIISNWDADAAANGDENGTSPAMAFFVLLAVTLTEITIFALAVKAGKALCTYLHGENCCDGSSSTTPSAPPASPVIVHMAPMPAPMVASSTPQHFWGRATSNLSRMFTTNRVHGDYTVLNGDEETEMVTVVPAASAPQYVIMTASPVTKINMV